MITGFIVSNKHSSKPFSSLLRLSSCRGFRKGCGLKERNKMLNLFFGRSTNLRVLLMKIMHPHRRICVCECVFVRAGHSTRDVNYFFSQKLNCICPRDQGRLSLTLFRDTFRHWSFFVHLLYLCIYFACSCHLLGDVLAATCLLVMMLLNPKELTASMHSMSLLGLRFLCLFKHPLPANRDHLQSQCQYPNFKASTNQQHEIKIENA